MISPAVAVALFTLSSELGRVTQSRDTVEDVVSEGDGVDMLEVLRSSLVTQAQEEIKRVYADVKPSGMCEAAVLQTVLDVRFLRYWLEMDGDNRFSQESSGLEATYDLLVHNIDPINWQTFEPLLEEAISTQSGGCHFILSYLLRRNQSIPRNVSAAPASVSSPKKKTTSYSAEDSSSLVSSNVMALVPAVPRFPLLPLPVDATTPTTPLSTRFPSPTRETAKAPTQYSYPFGEGPARAVAGAASAVLPAFSFSFISNQAASKASSLLRASKRS